MGTITETSRQFLKLRAHMKAAKAYAELSRAKRLKVGAVLVKDDRIISVGYNGTPAGGSNVCEELVQDGPTTEWVTKPEVVHAEMNVIAFAARNGVNTDNCTMVVTHSPCFECSKLLVQSGVKEIWYEEEYRLIDALQFLRDHNVKVERLDDEEKTGKT